MNEPLEPPPVHEPDGLSVVAEYEPDAPPWSPPDDPDTAASTMVVPLGDAAGVRAAPRIVPIWAEDTAAVEGVRVAGEGAAAEAVLGWRAMVADTVLAAASLTAAASGVWVRHDANCGVFSAHAGS
ncbi:hypothetical protein [Streptacidiphilus monticola]|uniref:Uncharacterized protein n=1 Tax=Streptacidiphilus monticola TaxID=2161674 RepID=A0ABW1GAP7_9ACTN